MGSFTQSVRAAAAITAGLLLFAAGEAAAEAPYVHVPPRQVEPGLPLVLDVDNVGPAVREVRVLYRDADGRYSTMPMTRAGAGFTAFVPVPSGAKQAEYYIEAEGQGGPWRTGGPDSPLVVKVGAVDRRSGGSAHSMGSGRFRFGPELTQPALIAGGTAFLLGLGAVATGVVGASAAADARDRFAREGIIDQPLVDSARTFGRVTNVLIGLAAASAVAGTTFFLFPDLLSGGDGGYSGGLVLRFSFDETGLVSATR